MSEREHICEYDHQATITRLTKELEEAKKSYKKNLELFLVEHHKTVADLRAQLEEAKKENALLKSVRGPIDAELRDCRSDLAAAKEELAKWKSVNSCDKCDEYHSFVPDKDGEWTRCVGCELKAAQAEVEADNHAIARLSGAVAERDLLIGKKDEALKEVLEVFEKSQFDYELKEWLLDGGMAFLRETLSLSSGSKLYEDMKRVVDAAQEFCRVRVCCHWNPETEKQEKEKCLHPLIEALAAMTAAKEGK